MNDVENELRSCVKSFVDDLSGLIRQQALEAVGHVLNDGVPVANGRRPTARLVDARIALRELPEDGRRPGEKRTSEELVQIMERLHGYIRSNAGQGIEQIARALNTTTKELTLPIHKLIADRRIGAKGEKRATRYFAK